MCAVNALPVGKPLSDVFFYLGILMLTLGVWHVCLDVSPERVYFVGTAGYALQHIAYLLYTLLSALFAEVGFSLPQRSLPEIVLSRLAYVVVALVFWLLVIRRLGRGHTFGKTNAGVLAVSSAIILVSVVLSSIVQSLSTTSNEQLVLVCQVYGLMSCALAIAVDLGIFARTSAEEENVQLEQILVVERRQQQLSRETIDAINRKCHDLKYQIAALEGMGNESRRAAVFRDLQRDVMVYDTMVKTGNASLDLVLAEKGLLARDAGVALSCMADGAALFFMTDEDVYAFFGNALDNAIEAQRLLPEEARSITLLVSRARRMLHVHVENPCAVEPSFEDGLPVTTKKDRTAHGFGTRSMRYIVRSYGGELRLSACEGVFSLDAVFPCEG